ncbi:hypothetical protein DESC_780023 [Desulfosarcina cetonica]|nr:hypothetical protein DESC_780023 [Desulfosarcina cetonica]
MGHPHPVVSLTGLLVHLQDIGIGRGLEAKEILGRCVVEIDIFEFDAGFVPVNIDRGNTADIEVPFGHVQLNLHEILGGFIGYQAEMVSRGIVGRHQGNLETLAHGLDVGQESGALTLAEKCRCLADHHLIIRRAVNPQILAVGNDRLGFGDLVLPTHATRLPHHQAT